MLQTASLINNGSYGLISLITALRKQWACLEVLIGPRLAINIYRSEQEWILGFCRLHILSSWCSSLSVSGGKVDVLLASISLTLSQRCWLQIIYQKKGDEKRWVRHLFASIKTSYVLYNNFVCYYQSVTVRWDTLKYIMHIHSDQSYSTVRNIQRCWFLILFVW